MKLHRFPRLGTAAVLLGSIVASGVVSGCQSQAAHVRDHWTGYNVGPSMSRAFLTYDAERDGNYRDFQWRKKKDIEWTIRRHGFNHNPDNPFEAVDPRVWEPRRNHSLVPAPQRYIHAEGLAFGGLFYAGGGLFIPVPVDSIIATMEEGGDDEFMAGVDEFTRPITVVTASFLHDTLQFPERRVVIITEE